MIRLGQVNLNELGLRIKSVQGLYDFPSIKNDGNNWVDEDYTEALNRLKDFQYNSKKITLDCFVSGADWSALNTSILAIKAELVSDSLRMLTMSDYSNLAYMVRLAKTTIFKPHMYFKNGRSMASFKIVFEEPQAFCIKFYWDFSEVDAGTSVALSFSVKKTTKSLSLGSLNQKYVTVYFDGLGHSINLEQEDYTFNKSGIDHILMPCVITGEIDSIEDILVTGSYPAQGVVAADYFLRNGSITT